jgi:hypothetical protein
MRRYTNSIGASDSPPTVTPSPMGQATPVPWSGQ